MTKFLKCDAAECDHVEHIEAITADMVGKPCPKCGANLLTQGDWDVYSTVVQPAMRAMVDLGLAKEATVDTPAAERMSINYHDGELRFKFPKATA